MIILGDCSVITTSEWAGCLLSVVGFFNSKDGFVFSQYLKM